jgi:hypothetical protein
MKTVKKTRTRWSQEDDELLIALVNKGQCSKEIAKILGRTRGAVWTRKYNLTLEDPKLNGIDGKRKILDGKRQHRLK